MLNGLFIDVFNNDTMVDLLKWFHSPAAIGLAAATVATEIEDTLAEDDLVLKGLPSSS